MLIGIDASRAVRPQRTGTEGYSLHLIRHLLLSTSGSPETLGVSTYRLYFNTPPPPSLFPATGNWQARVMPFPRLWTHLRLSLEMARHPPDVLFVPAHVLPVVHPRRSVVTVHDLGYLYYPHAHRLFDRLYLRWSTRYNARAASHLLADSQATRDDLVRHCGIPPQKVTVVYPGLDPALRPADEEAIAAVRRRYALPDDYLLYVGTLHPRKNLVRLVEAFARVQKDVRGQLVIAGKKGWLYQDIFRRVEELGLGERVLFPGYVPEADLPALLSGARLFVFPSLYEGFGFPVLEAMACGVPVVCSNASSLPEVVGEAALLVDPHDVDALAEAIVRAWCDKDLREELIARGFRQVRRFSWERAARQVLAVLTGISLPGF